jgi:hypothetical protein
VKAVVLCVLVWLPLVSCGIESISFVEGPDEPFNEDTLGATITFDHNNSFVNQSDDFLGYELYYKFYDDSVIDPWEDDQNSILAEPIPTGIGRLTNRGYRRIIRGDQEEAIPVILVTNKGLSYTIELDFFKSGGDTDAVASWDDGTPTTIILRRNTPADDVPGQEFRSFFGAFDEAHEDVDSDIEAAAAANELGVAIYGLGYGIEGGTFRQLYSEPVYLGYMLLDQNL